ncbi:hypothetical protein [Photobacterium kagoshimensis]|uniref:hypothetical protein n=1 Tax=Photobacterium kagoshimensis TaxID=2910242 RepID=UPI003D0FC36C
MILEKKPYTISYAPMPNYLPESEIELGMQIKFAFKQAKLECLRVIEDYDDFDWDSTFEEDKEKYNDNFNFLEAYKKRLNGIKKSELNYHSLDTFGKLKLLNFLTLQASSVISNYHDVDWVHIKEDETCYRDNIDYLTRYEQRLYEIQTEAMSKHGNLISNLSQINRDKDSDNRSNFNHEKKECSLIHYTILGVNPFDVNVKNAHITYRMLCDLYSSELVHNSDMLGNLYSAYKFINENHK